MARGRRWLGGQPQRHLGGRANVDGCPGVQPDQARDPWGDPQLPHLFDLRSGPEAHLRSRWPYDGGGLQRLREPALRGQLPSSRGPGSRPAGGALREWLPRSLARDQDRLDPVVPGDNAAERREQLLRQDQSGEATRDRSPVRSGSPAARRCRRRRSCAPPRSTRW